MRKYTGLPCPGCGLTRSFCAISYGQFAEAWAFNPFGYLFYAAALFLVAKPLFERLWPGCGARIARAKWFPPAMIAMVVAMWGFNLWRWHAMGGRAGV
ncbi:MAG TPA: DUF2752 domain-containing protein [Planctomycetota bacterium]|nr:DUF2752 domain-containing protein [Planctomycetota bacterium]